MGNQEILYKNEKLTKRLLELKSEKHKFTLYDKIKFSLLKSYNIPLQEKELIEQILRKEDHLRYQKMDTWQNEFGNRFPMNSDPYITEQGLTALRHNYYEVSFFIKKLNQIEPIFKIALTIITIIATTIGIRSTCSNKKLRNENELKQNTIDSLEVKIIELQNIINEK